MYIVCKQLEQQGLGMPSRDYFLDAGNDKFRNAYFNYMVTFAEHIGAEETIAEQHMTEVLEFEMQLANVSTNMRHRGRRWFQGEGRAGGY